MTNFQKSAYRKEIDGLRAIAVLSVIGYHTAIVVQNVNVFAWGYIGVDIFFVLSGYLITRNILFEMQDTGTFNLWRFYEKRSRRILPMLLFVICVSMPFAYSRLLPQAFVEYAYGNIASLTFVSNFFFYINTTSYGADSSLLKPFLHTWSLSIEEQFYLLFPAIVMFYYTKKTKLYYIIATLISLSFIISLIMSQLEPKLNFYLSVSRFWELLVGSLVAFRETNKNNKNRNFISLFGPFLGLLLLCVCIIVFDAQTNHPGVPTIIPVAGVAFIIMYASQADVVGRVLSIKPLVYLGLISYSAYLWHFPILAFARMASNALSDFEIMGFVIFTVILASISYHAIEKPFRNSLSRCTFWVTIIIATSLTLSFSTFVILQNGLSNVKRLGFAPEIVESMQPQYLFRNKGCREVDTVRWGESEFCVFGERDKETISYMLLGDSHAMHMQNLIDDVAKEHNKKAIFGGFNGCPPLLNIYPLRGIPHPSNASQKCFNINRDALATAQKYKISTVFLVARWEYYVDALELGTLQNFSDQSMKLGDLEYARGLYKSHVQQTYQAYKDAGIKVVVVLQVPHQNINIKHFFTKVLSHDNIQKRQKSFENALYSGVTVQEHANRQKLASSPWWQLAKNEQQNNLVIVDPTSAFCDTETCPFMSKNVAYYTDYDHASAPGLERLRNQISNALTWSQ